MAISRIETDSLASGLVAPTATALTTASGSAPSYSARAWVNFNGTGTVAIRAIGNVTSITDNGTGDYTVNFTTAMPDVNYSVCYAGQRSTTALDYGWTSNYNNAVGSTRIVTMGITGGSGNVVDWQAVSISIFR